MGIGIIIMWLGLVGSLTIHLLCLNLAMYNMTDTILALFLLKLLAVASAYPGSQVSQPVSLVLNGFHFSLSTKHTFKY